MVARGVDDQRADEDLPTDQAIGEPEAVRALVVLPDDQGRSVQTRQRHQRAFAGLGMLAVARHLLRRVQRCRLAQHRVGKAELANVVQQRRQVDLVLLVVAQAELLGHAACQFGDPARVPGDAALAHLHQPGEHRHRDGEGLAQLVVGRIQHVRDLLDLGHAGLHALLQRRVELLQGEVLALGFQQQLPVLGFQGLALERVARNEQQVLVVPGLGHVAVDLALVDGGDGRLDVGVAREQDAGDGGSQLSHLLQQFSAVHPGHAHVGDDHVHVLAAQHQQGLLAAGGLQQAVPRRPEQPTQRAQDRRLVVNQQQGRWRSARRCHETHRAGRVGHGRALDECCASDHKYLQPASLFGGGCSN